MLGLWGSLCPHHTHTIDTVLFCVLREARHHKHGHLGSFIRKLQFLFLLKQGFYYVVIFILTQGYLSIDF